MLGRTGRTALFLAVYFLCGRARAQQPPPSPPPSTPPSKPADSPRVQITGILKTGQGVPIPGATVRLVLLPSGQSWVTWTNESGAFDAPGLPAGQYRVEASQLGFEPASQILDVRSDKPQPIELSLRPAPLTLPPTTPGPETRAAGNGNTPPRGKPEGGGRTERTPPRADGSRPRNAQPPNGQPAGGRQGQPAFQQTDVIGVLAGGATVGDTSNNASTNGTEMSSSDAFVMSGTVGRGATAGGDYSFGSEGTPGAGRRGPGGPGGSGRAGGRTPQGPPGVAGGQEQPLGGAVGFEAIPVAQRMLRLAANRGRVSFYNRYGNSEADAKPYSITGAGSPKSAYYRERFGVNVGGPVHIPRLYKGKDKTFFFVNYEIGRNRDPVDSFSTVPLRDERMGDFTARGVQLFDPASNPTGPRTLFPSMTPGGGSVIPPGRLDSAAVALLRLGFIPPPNLLGAVQNFHLQARVPDGNDRLSVRVLHVVTPKLNLIAFYNLNSTRPETLVNFPDFLSRQSNLGQSLILGLSQTWSRRFLNDSRVLFTRNSMNTVNRFAFSQDVAGQLGITGVSTDPINFGVPQIGFTNFTNLNDPVPARHINQTMRLIDNLTFLLPKHTFRGGFAMARQQFNNRTDPVARGSFTFTGLLTSQLDAKGNPVPGTGLDFADFLLGLPQATTVRFGGSSSYFRNWNLNGYFSDDWRIHPRFTLTYGLRYDGVTPPIELFDHIANLDLNSDLTAVATVIPELSAIKPSPTIFAGRASPFHGALPRSLIRGDYMKWGPRVAIAWRPPIKRSMTLRAGYSIYYNNSIYTQLDASLANQPPFAQAQTLLASTTPGLTLEKGFPSVPLGNVANTVGVDPNYRVAYTQVWDLSTEMQLAPNLLFELTYTGTKGTHLDLLRSPNRLLPGTTLPRIPNAPQFTYDTFGASSIYHALQVRVQKRMTRGLMVQGVYTFAKSLDDASSIGGGTPVVVQDDDNFRAERGLSSFDIRHQFRLNYVYELPFGERKRWVTHGRMSSALGSLTLSGFATLATGTPFTARVLGSAANSSGTGPTFSGRADQVGDPNLPSDQRTALHYFNTAAFALPVPGQFGNAARNTIPGPGTAQFNMALAKTIQFGRDGQRRLDARLEAQNLFNHPNFVGLNTIVNSCAIFDFRRNSCLSTLFGRVQSARSMRQLDLALRWRF